MCCISNESRSARPITVLSAFDGWLAQMPQREIAATMFSKLRVEREWNDPRENLRDQVRRSIGYGQDLMNGGDCQFLRLTFARRIVAKAGRPARLAARPSSPAPASEGGCRIGWRAQRSISSTVALTSDIWHGAPVPREAWIPGPDPKRTSHGSSFAFSDPDSNAWIVQQVTTQRPGRA